MRRAISFRTIAPYALLLPGLLWLAIFLSIRRSRCSWCRSGRATSRTASSRRGTGAIYPEAFTGILAVDRALDRLRRSGHHPRLLARLPAGLRDRLPRRRLQEPAAVPGHRPVLHELPAAHPVLEDRSSPTTGSSSARSRRSASCPADFQLLATPAAVIAGITYNFLPFMTLPLYVALEKIDRRLLEAAEDLYAGPWRPRGTIYGAIIGGAARRRRRGGHGLRPAPARHPRADRRRGHRHLARSARRSSGSPCRWPCPASSPARCWCSSRRWATTSTPNCSGNPQSLMVGNVIQARYLRVTDYPTASALSFILMAGDPDRRLHLRPAARHRGPGLMAVARRARPGADLARQTGPPLGGPLAPAALRGRRDPVPGPAGRGHDRVQLQRPGRPVEPAVGNVLDRRLAGSARTPGPARGGPEQPRHRVPVDDRRDDPRDAHRAGARALLRSAAGRHEPADLPADVDAGDRARRLAADDVHRVGPAAVHARRGWSTRSAS